MKSGCISRELKAAGAIPGRANAGVNAPDYGIIPGYSKTGIRKSKTGRWRGAALIALNLFMIAHIIQWRLMGRTISPIEPSETMYTLQNGFVNAGFDPGVADVGFDPGFAAGGVDVGVADIGIDAGAGIEGMVF